MTEMSPEEHKVYKYASNRISRAKRDDWEELDLSGKGLTKLPFSIGRLPKLQALNLRGNKLTTIPYSLRQLSQLQNLDISDNRLTSIPIWLGELVDLRELGLSHIGLETVPNFLRNLTQLVSLDLSNNQLTSLPEWLVELTSLKYLNVRNEANFLSPYFDLSENRNLFGKRYKNKLTIIPEWLVDMQYLKELYIYDNPIIQPPPEQLGDSLTKPVVPVQMEAVRRYYVQLRQTGQAFFYEARLLLIGEGGTGKTSLACKLIDPTAELPPPSDSTEGIDVLQWQIPIPTDAIPDADLSGLQNPKGLTYQANIWDFGGQSVYHATHQFFLSKRSVYVLVADTRRQHTDFYDWLRMQEIFGEASPLILLKNKNRERGNQCVIENLPYLQERFPNLNKIIDLDLSNVPDEDEWPELLNQLQKQLMSLDHIGVPRPKTWVAIREVLNKDDRDSISRRQFLDICQGQGIDDEQDALQLSDYLHHVGDILHFEGDPILSNLVILKPTWALDAVYRVLDNPEVGDNSGQFSRQQLRALWHEAKYESHREQLLRLMQKFQLCYELRGMPDNFIAPQLLVPEAPDYVWQSDADDLQLRYRYPIFMPRGILSRGIVALHHRIEEQELVWRSGVILCDEFARAELLELRGEKEIRIRVTGGNKRDLLMEIVRALEELHRGFSDKLNYEKLVPCCCETCRSSAEPHFFALGKLLERLSHRKETIECNNPPYADVDIRSLIDDAILKEELRGSHVHYGDIINVGNINDARGMAFGRGAHGSASGISDGSE